MYFSIQRHLMAVLVLALSALVPLSAVRAATLPAGFAETVVASGLANPTAMEFAPDGRLFVGQQGGRLRVIKNGALLATPFVTLTVNSSGERGLLGVTFDPDFATNNFVYVYYTATTPNVHNRISRFTANGDVAVASSEVVILDLNPLSGATNHNGGAIHFGEDGKLYAAVGDNANGANAQTLGNLLGKILRINADRSVPTDNPFYGQAAGVNRAIWALGLRNPYTFSIEPVTGLMFINDVGQNTWEEIDEGVSGSNYGWPDTEGPTSDLRFDPPVYAYQHGAGTPTGCAITGGAFYNPQDVFQFPASYDGDYFFADYCSGWIYKLETSNFTATQFATGISSPVDLKVSDDGALYYLARGSGSTTGVVARIIYANAPPSITSHPSNRTVAVGQSATFSVAASGAAPLSYRWQRNGANIAGATSSSYTLASAQASDNGMRFRTVVTNPFGTATSHEATLTVTSNMAPVGTITQPAAGSLYSGGQTINFAGSATDAENGTLPASAFTWEVVFHHDTHIHPFLQPTSGITSGSFVIPTTGETAANVWYRILLTVRDSAGLTHTTFRDVLPRKVQVTVATNPAGLQVRIDGQPVTAPTTFTGVVGTQRTLTAVTPQTSGGTTYAFQSWSDGGAVQHSISTPASNSTYTATFAPPPPPPSSSCTQTPLTMSSAYSDGGFSYIVVRTFGTPADNSNNPAQSTLRFFENGTEMGPAHSSHSNIRNLGVGRFSHWGRTNGTGEALRFSASNNSNPRTNGRSYTYCDGSSVAPPPSPPPPPPPSSSCTQTPLTMSSAYSDGGFSYIVVRTFGTPADNSNNPAQSTLRFFENGTEMGPAHSSHSNIRNLGVGRFSHWGRTNGTGEALRFSASNNSNPRTNAKSYTYCVPVQ